MQEWHGKWLEMMEAESQEEGEEYAGGTDEDELDDRGEDSLYDGMVERGDMMTGPEHDGWRSMRGLEQVCRNAQAQYNGSAWRLGPVHPVAAVVRSTRGPALFEVNCPSTEVPAL